MTTPSEHMKLVGAIYNDAFEHCFENLAADKQPKVASFWVTLVAVRKPYLMVTENGMKELTREIFTDASLSDFVLAFTSTFFMFWSADDAEKERLIDVMASSLSTDLGGIAKFDSNMRAMPRQASNHLASPKDIKALLVANSWILVLVLASTFMTYKDLMPDEPVKKQRTITAEV